MDIALFNVLLFLTGITSGPWLSLFKASSYSAGIANSYIWNKRWTFQSTRTARVGEIGKFVGISGGALLVNVGTASFLIDVLGLQLGVTGIAWTNFSALVATLAAFVVNFAGYKWLVFKA
ncbi:MAG: GtrA family protein [Candidatus Daviesbacteria bacterium]|nr:GtrA family protein [Candidatus Daviesbacteria bacterium]